MSKANAPELAEKLYGKLQRLCQLFHRQGNLPFHLTAYDDAVVPSHEQSFAESYHWSFKTLNDELSEISPPGNLRWHPAISGLVTKTMAYQRENLLPKSCNTFADEAIHLLERMRGLYLRLWESIAAPMSREWKLGQDYEIWHTFKVDDNFGELSKGLAWEWAVVNRLVAELVVDEPELQKGKGRPEYSEQKAKEAITKTIAEYKRLRGKQKQSKRNTLRNQRKRWPQWFSELDHQLFNELDSATKC